MGRLGQGALWVATFAGLCSCDAFSDPATRIASYVTSGAGRLSSAEGTTYAIPPVSPGFAGQCNGPYKIQFDKVGAIIVWCMGTQGKTVSSHSTSLHRAHVDTADTFIVEKPAGAELRMVLERRAGRAVLSAVD